MTQTLQNGLELSAEEKRALLADLLRTKAAKVRRAPVSFAQQRLWFLSQLESDGSAFNISQAVRLIGPLDEPALEKSLNALVARHEPLRTNFELVNAEPLQVINPLCAVKLTLVDLRELPLEDRETALSRLITESKRCAFDLSHDPLLRASLFRLSEHEHVLLLTMHHIVSDGWSMGVFFRELGALYEAFVNGQPSPLIELPIQYSDFAVWQREWLRGEVLETQLDYWRKQLAGAPAVLELPTDKRRPLIQTFNGSYHSSILSPELGDFLFEFNRREGVTLFMTLLAAFQTMLYRYTNQEDIVVGTPIANRTRKETEGLIGFFVNTLVLRTDCSGNPTFRELLRRVREVALEAYGHQDIPFEKLVEELKPERTLNRMPLFQTFFAVQNAPKSILKLTNLELQEFPLFGQTAKFDLSLYVGETSEGLRLTFEYNTDLFNETTIVRMAGHMETLLRGIVSNPDERLANLPLLPKPERRLLEDWNETRFDYHPSLCLHELFEEQVERTPAATALTFADSQLSYRDLNGRANRLARYLRGLGVDLEVRVAIQAERSLDMIVGLLGILKAGGAYIPIEANCPAERVTFMIADSGASVLLTQKHLRESLPEVDCEVICLDADWPRITAESGGNLKSEVTPENAAHIIYTSGSTGTPKGVVGLHRASLNRIEWMRRFYPFAPGEVCCQKTSIGFIDSVWEIFGPLLGGVPLVVLDDDIVRDPHRFVAVLARNKVSRLVVVPSLLRVLLETVEQLDQQLSCLKYCICSGETLTLELVQKFRRHLPDCLLINLYGSSEVAADVTCYEVGNLDLNTVPIGRPLANTQVYILDDGFQPQPIGIPGEIHIGGDGLARGYLNRAGLTADKFVPHPFSSEPGSRLFRTGDVGRFLVDGNIEYRGRRDHQVKIRGVRIEPGEIEAKLAGHPQVRENLVVARDYAGDQRLIAYVVPHDPAPGSDALRAYLQESLPENMLPFAFVMLDRFPLTVSGKINRMLLPAPEETRPQLEAPYTSATTEAEQIIVAVWQAVLQLEKVGTGDNFFDLGGHSLLLVKVHSRLRASFEKELSMTDLFRYPTIRSLAKYLSDDQNATSTPPQVQDRARKQKEALLRRRESRKARPID
jgi:amino acid adenylation domain-containing protein